MKKLTLEFLTIALILFVPILVLAQQEPENKVKPNENLRIIVKIDKKIVPGLTLITKTENIRSESIHKLLK